MGGGDGSKKTVCCTVANVGQSLTSPQLLLVKLNSAPIMGNVVLLVLPALAVRTLFIGVHRLLQDLVEFYQTNTLKEYFKDLDTPLLFPFKEPEQGASPPAPGKIPYT